MSVGMPATQCSMAPWQLGCARPGARNLKGRRANPKKLENRARRICSTECQPLSNCPAAPDRNKSQSLVPGYPVQVGGTLPRTVFPVRLVPLSAPPGRPAVSGSTEASMAVLDRLVRQLVPVPRVLAGAEVNRLGRFVLQKFAWHTGQYPFPGTVREVVVPSVSLWTILQYPGYPGY
eukprot:3231898-Rhodomonas_salina.3